MRPVHLPGALPHPDEVARQVVGTALVEAGQRPLVLQDQRLVRGVQLDGVQRRVVHPAGPHEPHGAVDLTGQLLVARAGVGGRREGGVPGVDPVERGETTAGVGAQQVEGGRGGRVRPQDPLRVRGPLAVQVVDHVAAVGQQPRGVQVGRPRLGVLAGDPAELHHRHGRAVGEHHRHLQQHPDLARDVGLRAGGEGLRAVAALQQERLAPRHLGQPLTQLVDLGGHHQRRHPGQGQRDLAQRPGVRPVRLLRRRQLPPRVQTLHHGIAGVGGVGRRQVRGGGHADQGIRPARRPVRARRSPPGVSGRRRARRGTADGPVGYVPDEARRGRVSSATTTTAATAATNRLTSTAGAHRTFPSSIT